uniref:Sulfurtransferase complex subunit TusB n=1 Tax=candidate division WOR-3 bacterium TaxID=2052148 RepID=A0A7V0Z3J7_UNCW3
MKTLWLLTQTPNQENIKLLKRLVDETDCIVFIQNGVYIAKHNIDITCQKYVLKSDMEARGIDCAEKIIEYSELVDLFFGYDRVVTI